MLTYCVAINKAYKMFGDEEQIQFCRDVAEEAKKQLDKRVGLPRLSEMSYFDAVES